MLGPPKLRCRASPPVSAVQRLLGEVQRRRGPGSILAAPLVEELVAALVDLYGAGMRQQLAHALEGSVVERILRRPASSPASSICTAATRCRPTMRVSRALARVSPLALTEAGVGVEPRRRPQPGGGLAARGDADAIAAHATTILLRLQTHAASHLGDEIDRVEIEGHAHTAAAHRASSASIAWCAGEGLLASLGAVRACAAARDRRGLCVAPLTHDHRHAVDLKERRLLCVCRPCALLFDGDASRSASAAGARARAADPGLPARGRLAGARDPGRRGVLLPRVDHEQVDRDLAEPRRSDGVRSSTTTCVGPLRAGAFAARARPRALDVQALLVRGARAARPLQAFLVAPIDRCYEFVGIVRRKWRGFDGGDEVSAAEPRPFLRRPRARRRAAWHADGRVVKHARAQAIADTVLLEGYVLYPYRCVVKAEEPIPLDVRRGRTARFRRAARRCRCAGGAKRQVLVEGLTPRVGGRPRFLEVLGGA